MNSKILNISNISPVVITFPEYNLERLGTAGGVIVSKLDEKIFKSEFKSHWEPYSYGLVPHLNKMLSKLLQYRKVAF